MTLCRLLPLASLGLLAACAAPSAPNYYTLVPDAPARAASVQARARAGVVDLLPITVPAPVDTPQMVIRTGQGEVMPLNGERWAGPLADEIWSALAGRLATGLGMPVVRDLRPDDQTPVLRVQVEVQRFDSLPGKQAVLDVVWRVRPVPGPGGRAGQARASAAQSGARTPDGAGMAPVCRSHFETAAVAGMPALVQAHQYNLAALGDAIAAAARAAEAGRPTCPD